MNIQTLALQLRQLTVTEWIEHSSLYNGFLTDIRIEEEAPKFLVQGYFHGDLADTMLTSLSNALQTPIVVFSSIACHPFFCVMPNTQTIPIPLMVAFSQCGVRHYDGITYKGAVMNHLQILLHVIVGKMTAVEIPTAM